MARTLVRPSLYGRDFLAWTEQQAALLRAGRLDQLDLDNLAERTWAAANAAKWAAREWGGWKPPCASSAMPSAAARA